MTCYVSEISLNAFNFLLFVNESAFEGLLGYRMFVRESLTEIVGELRGPRVVFFCIFVNCDAE